jgi:hypothetical protein
MGKIPPLLRWLRNGQGPHQVGEGSVDGTSKRRLLFLLWPIIRDFYIEDGKAYVNAEGSVEVQFHYCRHPGVRIRAISDATMTEASMPVGRFFYIRASVMDNQGRRAWTNPIFLNEV